MSQDAANKLEAWFAGLPGIVHSTLHQLFTWMNESLKAVSGDPPALIAAGPQYLQVAAAITDIAEEQLRDRDNLAPVWSGDAHDAFDAFVDLIDYQLRGLTDALGRIQPRLPRSHPIPTRAAPGHPILRRRRDHRGGPRSDPRRDRLGSRRRHHR